MFNNVGDSLTYLISMIAVIILGVVSQICVETFYLNNGSYHHI